MANSTTARTFLRSASVGVVESATSVSVYSRWELCRRRVQFSGTILERFHSRGATNGTARKRQTIDLNDDLLRNVTQHSPGKGFTTMSGKTDEVKGRIKEAMGIGQRRQASRSRQDRSGMPQSEASQSGPENRRHKPKTPLK